MPQLATDAYEPEPLEASTFTGTTVDVKDVPATPSALFVEAAAIPATCVPWPLSSSPVSETHVPLRQYAPSAVSICAARSGWVESTPVSTTASFAPPPAP